MALINVLVAIDGSHDNKVYMNDLEFDNKFKGSHVRIIYDKSLFPHNLYVRGPAGLGFSVASGLRRSLEFLCQIQKAHASDALALHLVGFSRGAAMCLELANWLSTPKAVTVRSMGAPLEAHLCNLFLGQLNKSLIKVRALGMFDAVDMSLSMVCDPVDPRVERAVLIRRAGWRSRDGWTNVGDKWPPATAKDAVRERWPLIGTHGAMGGQPANGDVPIPLAKELLNAMGSPKLPRNQLNWTKATIRWRQIDAAGGIENIKKNSPTNKKMTEQLFDNQKTSVARNQGIKYYYTDRGPAINWEQVFFESLKKYANQDFGSNPTGIDQVIADGNLGGFPGIKHIFQDVPICAGIVARYVELDKKASANALTLMRKGLGQAFPATL